MKKSLVISMIFLLLLSTFLGGCGSKEVAKETKPTTSTSETTEKETPKEDTTKEEAKAEPELAPQEKPVRILNHLMGGKDPDENELFMEEAKRLSGIEVEIVKVPGSDVGTKIASAIAAGEDYDIMILSGKAFEKLFPLGAFEDITDRIYNSDVLGNPDIIPPERWEPIKKDGRLYGVLNKYEGGRLPLVRADWLHNLNITEPTTMDDYYEMLRAFTFDDPDQNGQDDTIGLTMKKLYDIEPFMSSKGLVDGFAKDADGKWYIPWATDEAAEIYDFMAKLYDEGILDSNFATNGSSNCREQILNGKAGMMTYWDNWTGLFNDKLLAADPNTTAEIIGLAPVLDDKGNGIISTPPIEQFSILSTSKNKDYAFKYLEFIHTNPGIQLCSLGIENHDYIVKDGKVELTEIGQQHAMDHGMPQSVSKQWKNPIGVPKNFLQSQALVNKYGVMEIAKDTTKEAKEVVEKYGIQCIMGEFSGAEAVKLMQEELKALKLID